MYDGNLEFTFQPGCCSDPELKYFQSGQMPDALIRAAASDALFLHPIKRWTRGYFKHHFDGVMI